MAVFHGTFSREEGIDGASDVFDLPKVFTCFIDRDGFAIAQFLLKIFCNW